MGILFHFWFIRPDSASTGICRMLCVWVAVTPKESLSGKEMDNIWSLICDILRPVISTESNVEYDNIAVCLRAYSSVNDPNFFVSECFHVINKLFSSRSRDSETQPAKSDKSDEREKKSVTIFHGSSIRKPAPSESSLVSEMVVRPSSLPIVAEHLLAISSDAQSKV